MNYITMDSPIGILTLTSEGDKLIGLRFGKIAEGDNSSTEVLERAKAQLEAYFSKKLTVFDLPIDPRGTEFRKRVWNALLEIPYGQKRTYGEIAAAIGSPKGVRAVGNANHHNPISIIIPCHRVVGYNGALTGYAGGLDIKKFLLELEQRDS